MFVTVRREIYSEVCFLWFNIRGKKGVLSVGGWKSFSGLGGDPRKFMARAYIRKGDFTKFYLLNMAFFIIEKNSLFWGRGVDNQDSNLGFLILH